MENKSPDTKSKREKVEKAEKMPAAGRIPSCLESCSDKDNCLSLNDILRSFNAPLSEEQAWSLIYQSVLLYRNFIRVEFIDKHTGQKSSHRIKVPKATKNLNVHKDGSVHISDSGELHSIARGGVDTDNKKKLKINISLCCGRETRVSLSFEARQPPSSPRVRFNRCEAFTFYFRHPT